MKLKRFLLFALTQDLCVVGASKDQSYPFGIMGMSNKADCLQKGEFVKFQICTIPQTGQKMACNIVPQRRAIVECVKDQVVNTKEHYTVGAQLIFLNVMTLFVVIASLVSSHMKWATARNCSFTSKKCKTAWSSRLGMRWSSQLSLINAQESVVPVMFAESGEHHGLLVWFNEKPGNASEDLWSLHFSEGPKPVVAPRPDRLVNRLKSITLDDASAPRLVIVRQPRGPDNSKVSATMHCVQLYQ